MSQSPRQQSQQVQQPQGPWQLKDPYAISLFQQNSYGNADHAPQVSSDGNMVLQQQAARPWDQRVNQNAPLQHLNLQNNFMLHQVPFDTQSPLLKNEQSAQSAQPEPFSPTKNDKPVDGQREPFS